MRSASGIACVVEEDLGEVRVAVHLAERPHVDARRVRRSIPNAVMPWCFGTAESCRASSSPYCEYAPRLVHTFWPCTRHSSPSACARVDRPARSEPAPGSEKSWHQISSPVAIGGSQRAHCSGGAVREQRRADQLEPDEVGVEVGHVEVGELAADDRDLGRGRAEPAVLARPRRRREPAAGERFEVPAARFEVVVAGAEHRDRSIDRTRREPRRELRTHPRAEVGSACRGSSSGRPASSSSRSGAFCTLPLAVRGKSARSSSRDGQLEARETLLERGGPRSSSSVGAASRAAITNAHTSSPMTGSGAATHAASATPGCVTSSASTSCGGDVLAAADDHVLQPVDDREVLAVVRARGRRCGTSRRRRTPSSSSAGSR